jgi:hypothetical protein
MLCNRHLKFSFEKKKFTPGKLWDWTFGREGARPAWLPRGRTATHNPNLIRVHLYNCNSFDTDSETKSYNPLYLAWGHLSELAKRRGLKANCREGQALTWIQQSQTLWVECFCAAEVQGKAALLGSHLTPALDPNKRGCCLYCRVGRC